MKKLISIFMIIITTISATGCKGIKQEIETLAVVMASGYDLIEDNTYMITVQILNTQKESSSKMGSQKGVSGQIQTDVLVYSATGISPFDAIKNISTILGKPLFWGHSEFTVLGQELAEAGLSLYIDASLRSALIRPNTPLLVTKGRASNIISNVTKDSKIPADAIENLMKTQEITGLSPVVSRLDFVNALSSKTGTSILGVVEMNNMQYTDAKFKMAGTAVFKKDKLIGYLNAKETRGMQWIRGKVKTGSISFLNQANEIVTFEILKASSKVKPILKDDSVIMQISINEKGNLKEINANLNPMENYKVMDELNEVQEKAIKKEIELALNAAQKELNADIFDFGGIIYRSYPEVWKKLENNWEHIFPTIEVDINVNSNLQRPGMISKPIQ